MTAWANGFPARTGCACRGYGAVGGVRPQLRTTQVGTGHLLGPKPIPPARPACGDPAAMLAAMSTRDKLAQLLMVGVRNGDDAKAVVADHHVGGIFIGSWTDLSMLTNGTVKNLSASTALPVAISVDEEGGRVARLSSLIGPSPVGAGAGPDPHRRRGLRHRAGPGPPDAWPGHHGRFRSSGRRHRRSRRHRDRRPVVQLGSGRGHRIRRRICARSARRRAAAGAQAFSRATGTGPATRTPVE